MRTSSKEDTLFLHQFLQKPHIFIEPRNVFHTLMMEGLSFLGDEHDIVAPGNADIGDAVIESTTIEVTCYGRSSMLSGEDNPETIVSNLVGEYIRYESVRKKRFTKS